MVGTLFLSEAPAPRAAVLTLGGAGGGLSEGAGHLIAPPGYEPNSAWTNRFELGGSREATEFANADSWPKVLGFLQEAFSGETEAP